MYEPIMKFGNYELYNKEAGGLEFNKPLKTWIKWYGITVGEFNFKLRKDGECFVDLLLISPPHRYHGLGSTFIWSLMFELTTMTFKECEVYLRGVSTPIEGEGFWKKCFVTFKKPVYSKKEIIFEDEVEKEIVGIPFELSGTTFRRLDIDYYKLVKEGRVFMKGILKEEISRKEVSLYAKK